MGMLLRRRKSATNITNLDALAQNVESAIPNEVVEESKTEFVEPIIEVVQEKVQEEVSFPYTKTDITKMSTADLKKIAKKFGVDKNLTGIEIKKQLIEKYNL